MEQQIPTHFQPTLDVDHAHAVVAVQHVDDDEHQDGDHQPRLELNLATNLTIDLNLDG